MSNNNDKTNVNGTTTDPLQRLASLKPPRDLSLGGVKTNRKVFTPNLNVTRNKNNGPSSSGTRGQNKDERNKRNYKNDKNKNFKNGPKIIKSGGVFSEGLGSVERQTSRFSFSRNSDGAQPIQKPTLRVKNIVKIDKELDDQKIKSVFETGGCDEEESEDFKHVHDVEAPVKLPMDDGGWSHNQTAALKIKQEVVVKQEPSDHDGPTPIIDEKPPVDIKEVFEDTNVVNLLRSDKPSLILLQLADTLPGRGGSEEDTRKKPDQPATGDEKPPVDSGRCLLSDLEEGRIGKMRVHRSGRVTLALGDTVFEVCSGTKASFYQEVVSVGVDEPSRSAHLVSLGPLQHKLNVTPHWETMFNNMAL